jgi:ABC transport system ATP-binding/permease protein
VAEALGFTARLRLPNDTTDHEIEQRIEHVLSKLQISHIRNSIIGSPTRKVVSGGERKRVNLAMELLADPSVLFLDEPTSGLSSEDALTVMQGLRELAREGRTILLTIHQPSLDVFRLMDNLAVVGKDVERRTPAQLVYYGPAFPEAIRFFDPEGGERAPAAPEQVLRGLARRTAAEWAERYRSSPIRERFVEQRAGRVLFKPAGGANQRSLPSLLNQVSILFRRGLRLKTRDLWNTGILLGQAPIIAFLLVLVFGSSSQADATPLDWQQAGAATSTTLFLMGIAALWFGCSNAAREIVAERAILGRERMVGLRLPAYLASKLTLLGSIGLMQCALLVLIVKLGCRVHSPWLPLLGCLLLSTLVGTALGLLISAIAASSEVAISLVPIAILPMVMLGGMMQPVHGMDQPARTLAQLMPSRWAFELAVATEARHRPLTAPGTPKKSPEAGDRQDVAEPYFPGKRRIAKGGAPGVLLVQALLLSAATIAILRSRDTHL